MPLPETQKIFQRLAMFITRLSVALSYALVVQTRWIEGRAGDCAIPGTDFCHVQCVGQRRQAVHGAPDGGKLCPRRGGAALPQQLQRGNTNLSIILHLSSFLHY